MYLILQWIQCRLSLIERGHTQLYTTINCCIMRIIIVCIHVIHVVVSVYRPMGSGVLKEHNLTKHSWYCHNCVVLLDALLGLLLS